MYWVDIAGCMLIILFAFYPHMANADNGCHCNQAVTLEGTVIGIEFTPDNHYYILTNLTCGEYKMNGVNIKGQGKPPSTCKKKAHFKVSGTVNCEKVYNISIIPSKLGCFFISKYYILPVYQTSENQYS